MKTQTILSTIFILGANFIANASADYTCYDSGHIARIKDLEHHSERACQGYDDDNGVHRQGAFQGFYGPNERKTACVNVGNNRINMEVQNLNTKQGFDIDDVDCVAEFWDIPAKCWVIEEEDSRGGVAVESGWYFR